MATAVRAAIRGQQCVDNYRPDVVVVRKTHQIVSTALKLQLRDFPICWRGHVVRFVVKTTDLP